MLACESPSAAAAAHIHHKMFETPLLYIFYQHLFQWLWMLSKFLLINCRKLLLPVIEKKRVTMAIPFSENYNFHRLQGKLIFELEFVGDCLCMLSANQGRLTFDFLNNSGAYIDRWEQKRLYFNNLKFEARGVRKVTREITNLWQPSIYSDISFWSFEVGFS